MDILFILVIPNVSLMIGSIAMGKSYKKIGEGIVTSLLCILLIYSGIGRLGVLKVIAYIAVYVSAFVTIAFSYSSYKYIWGIVSFILILFLQQLTLQFGIMAVGTMVSLVAWSVFFKNYAIWKRNQ